MEMNRVKQIISSPKEITVTYHGVPVWLNHYNDSENSVSAFTKDNPDEVLILPADELVEE